MDADDATLNDPDATESIRNQLTSNHQRLTVSELEREVDDTDQIALRCLDGLPAGLSDKLLNSIRWLRLSEISEDHWTE